MIYTDPTTGEWVGEYEIRDSDGEITRLTEWLSTEEQALRFEQKGE